MNAFRQEVTQGCLSAIVGLSVAGATGLSAAILMPNASSELRAIASGVGCVCGAFAVVGTLQRTEQETLSWLAISQRLDIASKTLMVSGITSLICASAVSNKSTYPERPLDLYLLGSACFAIKCAKRTTIVKGIVSGLVEEESRIAFDKEFDRVIQQEKDASLPDADAVQQKVLLPTPAAIVPAPLVNDTVVGATQERLSSKPINDRTIDTQVMGVTVFPSVVDKLVVATQERLPSKPIDDRTINTQVMGATLINALQEYKIKCTWEGAIVGPTFIRCLIQPSTGVKFEQIKKLKPDLRLRLELKEEPFIGHQGGYVSIDIPRSDRQTVYFHQYFPQPVQLPTNTPLLMAIGVNLSGILLEVDLSDPKNCHSLSGGTTGSGKSEFLRAALASIVWRYSPAQVKLLIIDPKRVTFPEFKNTPFLLRPIIKNTEEAIPAMEQMVAEMERRYQLFEETDSKDLKEYTIKTRQLMPRIIIVCDEFADLMVDSEIKKKLESSVKRLGAKARAAGISLMLATQRPEQSVVTPLIRSNLPARIALKTLTKADSAIILGGDTSAFNLSGKGDLLFDGQRLQSLYVSDWGYLINQADENIVFPDTVRGMKAKLHKWFKEECCTPFDVDSLRRLPTHPGVYLVADGDGKAYYIGESQDIRYRWNNPKQPHHWLPAIQELGVPIFIYWRVCENRKELEAVIANDVEAQWNGKNPGVVVRQMRAKYRTVSSNVLEQSYESPIAPSVIPEEWKFPDPFAELTPELKDAIVASQQAGWSQNQSISQIWGLAKSGTDTRYAAAVNTYQEVLRGKTNEHIEQD